MLDKSVNDFLRKLSSKEPVPGGGSVAALLGSMCCALGDMVCNLTIGKVKYSEYDYINQQIRSKLYDLQNEFNDLCYQDIEVFNRLVNTYKLPGITSEEIEYKEKVMTPLIYDAISVPISVMKKSVESLQYIDELKNHSSKLAISDIGVAVSCAKSCLESAAMNVYINTSMISDKNRSKEINNEANELLHKGISIANKIYNEITQILTYQLK